jgi:hypothetical protein
MPGGLFMYYTIFGLALVASIAAFVILRSRQTQSENASDIDNEEQP